LYLQGIEQRFLCCPTHNSLLHPLSYKWR
jgi:hypothetical protein